MPPPTSVPGSTLVLVLCGHPLQKNGARSTDEGDQRTSDGRRWQRRETVVEAGRKAGPERRDQSLGVEDAAGGDQRLALVVTPADDPRALVPVVERIAYEPLERRVLLLDDDDLGEAVGELAHLRRLERHGHEQLEQADAGAADRVVVGEPEQLERLAHLVVRRAAGSDADPVVLAADRDPVEAVEHAVLAGQLGAHLEELALHVERVRRHQPTVGVWHERLPSKIIVGICGTTRSGWMSTVPVPSATWLTSLMPAHSPHDRDRATAWRLRSSASCTSPGKKIGMCRSTIVASLDDGSVDDLAAGSSPTSGDDATVLGRAGEHAVADGVAGPIESGRLAVPHADDAVVGAVGERARQLAAHHRGGRQLFVGAGLAHDRQVGDGTGGALDLVAEGTDGRSLVAGHERGRVEAAAAVAADLVEWQPGDRLQTGQEHPAVLESVSIGQLVSGELGLLDHVGH